MKKYEHITIEKRWRESWIKEGIYVQKINRVGKPFYNLWMYPYPSAEGLHAGHAFSSTGSDVYGRFIRMQGKDVFQPIGYDSFGIHSENFALKIGQHPKNVLERTTKNYERQLKSLGHGYDWTRTVTTSEPNYYKWTQWLFTQMFKAGLAYRRKANVNFCPSCKTVLADEQVIAGECERCGTFVEAKELEQWFFKITDYADKLLEGLARIDWPEKIKVAQRNWIGRSEGATIKFPIFNSQFSIESFTTRPDTLYGATFFVLAPEHPQVLDVTISKCKKSIQKYIKASRVKKKEERIAEAGKKTGIATGGYVLNPATGGKIPVFVADYVVMDYGTGAIMGVPAHDVRDWEFAKKFKLPISEVISGGNVNKAAYDGEGKLVNSGDWNGIEVPKDLEKIIADVEKKGWGKKAITYHLRDWLVSRQRYWGAPIPMVFCQKCADEGKSWFTQVAKHSLGNSKFQIPNSKKNGNLLHSDQFYWNYVGWYPVEEQDLPVELPYFKDYKPEGTGRGPLANHPEFYETTCPECGGKARRETDVLDTFVDSSWYFLRYPSVGSVHSGQAPFDPKITEKWLPVNLYFGGAEHSVLHLMYSRFVWKVLRDLGYFNFPAKSSKGHLGGPATMPEKALGWDEPFPRFFAHGLVIKDGAKMSKSRGNVVNPDDYIEKFGADTLRLYLMFMGPMDGYPDFRDTGIEGMRRFIERVWQLFQVQSSKLKGKSEEDANEILVKMHQTIIKVTEDIESFRYNTAISAIMEYVNALREAARDKEQRTKGKGKKSSFEWREALKTLALLIAPFAPHLAEEAWVNILGQTFSIHTATWPKCDASLIKEEKIKIVVQENKRVRDVIEIDMDKKDDEKYVLELVEKSEKVKKALAGKKVINEIYIPGKIVNIATKD